MDIGNIQVPIKKTAQEGQVTVVRAISVSEAEALENFRRRMAERQQQGMVVSTPVLTAVERLQTLNPAPTAPGGWVAFTDYAGKNPLQTVAAVAGIAAALKYLLTGSNRRD